MLKINIKIISKANNSSLMVTNQMLEINVFRMEGPANMQKFSMHSSFKDNEARNLTQLHIFLHLSDEQPWKDAFWYRNKEKSGELHPVSAAPQQYPSMSLINRTSALSFFPE